MAKLTTVAKAKEEILRLQHFIDLVESYEADTLDKCIIKEYAYTNSIREVAKNLKVESNQVLSVLKSMGNDELHKMIRTGYFQKTRSQRRSGKNIPNFYQC